MSGFMNRPNYSLAEGSNVATQADRLMTSSEHFTCYFACYVFVKGGQGFTKTNSGYAVRRRSLSSSDYLEVTCCCYS